MKKIIIIVVIIAIIIAIIGFVSKKSKGNIKHKTEEAKSYVVKKGKITVKLEETGEIQPIKEIKVKSIVSGKILKFFVEEGDFIENGDIIADIEPDYNQAEKIARVKSTLELTEIKLKNAKRDYLDKLKLFEDDYISQREIDSYEDALTEAEINYNAALQQYKLIKDIETEGNVSKIVSTASGTVIQKSIEEGEMVVASTNSFSEGTVILTLADLDRMIVDSRINEVDISKIRLIAVGHTSDTHWIVRKDSPIKTINDFKGKRIGVGPAGSATLSLFSKEALAKGWGLSFDDFSPKYISFSEIITGIRDNTIDAGNISAGTPVAAIMELANDIPIRLISITQESYDRLHKANPIFQPKTIKAGTYKGIDQDVKTYCLPQMWICSASLPEDLVYNIIKIIYDNDADRNAIHPMAKMYTVKNAFFGYKAVPTTFHPGAIKYYKEKGVWDKRDEM